jgi:hypothetical protein
MVRTLALLVSLAAALPAHAVPAAPSFEQSLNAGHARVITARAAQVKAKSAPDIQSASWDTERSSRQASSLRLTLSDLRRRAQDARRRNPPKPDAVFKSQLDRFVWDLRTWDQDLRALERRAMDLSNTAAQDADSVAPAQQLVWDAQNLRTETSMFSSDGTWLASDLRALGFNFEALDVERLSRDGGDSARQLGYDADAILTRVR